MKTIFLVGGGGHCRSCIDTIEAGEQYKICGIVDEKPLKSSQWFDYPWLGGDDALPSLISNYGAALVAVGQVKCPTTRVRLYKHLKTLGAELPVVKSPLSYVSKHTKIKSGTIVLHGAIINAAAYIGENCIINSQALIEHDVKIGSHSHISTGAKINGNAQIGGRTFIGSGAIVHHGVQIGDDCIIGASVNVRENLPPNTILRDEKWKKNLL